MIQKISIKNFALIDNTEIEFNKGLNVLSGETGSGKSIIIDAINFALGAKADRSCIRYGADDCMVTVTFLIDNEEVKKVLDEFDVEYDDELIIKRKFTLEGKSSIKVNGESFTGGMLKKVTSLLVDVHGQSEHYSLLDNANQLGVLDKFCKDELIMLKQELIAPISELKSIAKDLKRLNGNSDGERRLDILKYQIDEIKKANIKEGEEEKLVEKRKIIINAEKIIGALNEAYSLLNGDERGVDSLMQAARRISQISTFGEDYLKISERLDEVLSMVNELTAEIKDKIEAFDFSEQEADEIEKRLDEIKEIKRKYGGSYEAIISFKEKAEKEYEEIINSAEIIEKLTVKKEQLLKEIDDVYSKITECRKRNAKVFCEKVTSCLKTLAMNSAVFEISFSEKEDLLSLNGRDEIEFMFSANKGEPLKNMAKTISGGEMSRFMLSLKSEISSLGGVSTYIFDEIDAGISGNVANTMAKKFVEISKNKQIVAISHLAQITSMSDASFLIYKYEDDNKTYSSIKALDYDGKVDEIIRLIGGEIGDGSAKTHAENMIKTANEFKNSVS